MPPPQEIAGLIKGLLTTIVPSVPKIPLIHISGQIITTTDFPQKIAFWKGKLLISGKSRLVKYYKLARYLL